MLIRWCLKIISWLCILNCIPFCSLSVPSLSLPPLFSSLSVLSLSSPFLFQFSPSPPPPLFSSLSVYLLPLTLFCSGVICIQHQRPKFEYFHYFQMMDLEIQKVIYFGFRSWISSHFYLCRWRGREVWQLRTFFLQFLRNLGCPRMDGKVGGCETKQFIEKVCNFSFFLYNES